MTIARVKSPPFGVGEKLTSAQINDIDVNVTNALDKRSGQSDTLASTVSISAAGSILAAASGAVIAASANGAVIKASHAGSLIRTETGGRIELADNDYPTLSNTHTGRSVTRVMPMYDALVPTGVLQPAESGSMISPPTSYTVPNDTDYEMAAGHIKFGLVDTGSTSNSKCFLLWLNPHLVNGHVLDSVTVTFLASGHSSLPVRQPRVRIGRLSSAGADTYLQSTGIAIMTKTMVVDYDTTTSIVAAVDQNEVIDKSEYRYYVQIWNEGGSNALSGLTVKGVSLQMYVTDLRVP